jgi:hypothetical protein
MTADVPDTSLGDRRPRRSVRELPMNLGQALLSCFARARVVSTALLAVAGLSAAPAARAGEPTPSPTPTALAPTRLTLDHKTGQAFLKIPGKTPTPVESGDRKRAPKKRKIVVQIENTNTALYSYAATATEVEPDEIAALRGFLGGLKPYLTEAATRIAGADFALREEKAFAANRVTPLVERYEAIVVSLKEIVKQLQRLDRAVSGDDGLEDTEARASTTLNAMAWGEPAPRKLAGELCAEICGRFEDTDVPDKTDRCSPPAQTTRRLTAVRELTEAFSALLRELSKWAKDDPGRLLQDVSRVSRLSDLTPVERKAIRDLRVKVTAIATDEHVEEVIAAAKKARDDAPTVNAAAGEVETLAKRVIEARDTWCSEPIEISAMVGKEVSVEVTAQTDPELGHRPPLRFHATLLPNWPVRPALGLTLLGSPDSRFPQYVTKEAGMGFQIVQSGEQDSRFTYGLTLATTWQGLDRRDERNKRWAIWFPEVTINPSDDVRAFGLGAGVSFWKILKIGGGILWTKHKVLVGQSPGDILPTADALRLRDAYGKPDKWYVGISLIGWPPFVPAP